MTHWWETFFDDSYLRLWEGLEAGGDAARQAEGIWTLLGLEPGDRVLDAPCGYGRISRELAERGASVLGVDYSKAMLAEAERRRGDLSPEALRFERHDLREPLSEGGFDAAINVFSSLGYGSEADDLRILRTLEEAVRPGGLVFVESMHRDQAAVLIASGGSLGSRHPDGTLVLEEARMDPLTGRVDSVWRWSGPAGSGEKSSSIRMYTATELVRLVEAAGLRVRSTHRGCFPEPFVATDGTIAKRMGIVAVREA